MSAESAPPVVSEADPDPRRFAGFGFLALGFLAAITGAQALPLLQTLAGLFGARWRVLPKLARDNALWLLPAMAALVWALASAGWSHTPDAVARAAKQAGVVAAALLFCAAATATPHSRSLTRLGCWAGCLSLAVLGLAEAFGGMPLNRVVQPDFTDIVRLTSNPGRGITVLILLQFPAIAAARGMPPAVVIITALLTAVLSTRFDMSANMIALIAGWAAFEIAYLFPRLALWLAGLVWAGWLLVFPWLVAALPQVPAGLPLSWRQRIAIWDFAQARVIEKPLLGWGFEASRNFPGRQTIDGVPFGNIPLHPHSGSMQIWLETGLVGAVLGAVLCVAAGAAASKALAKDRLTSGAAAGVAAAAFVFFNVSYGAWQEWLWAAIATAAACVAAGYQPEAGKRKPLTLG